MKSSDRRFGAENSATRAALIKAGIEVLQEEGSRAFTARRVAEKAGLKPQLVHYYFRTIEDMVIAIVRVAGAEGLKRTVRAAASDQPLRELWKACKHEGAAALTAEVKALAQHSEAIRAEAVRLLEQHRTLVAAAIGRHFELRGITLTNSPMAIAIILEAITRLLVDEKALGSTLGHEEFETAIEGWLDNFYNAAPALQEGGRTAA